jgi:hypothetical protein
MQTLTGAVAVVVDFKGFCERRAEVRRLEQQQFGGGSDLFASTGKRGREDAWAS